MGTREKLIKSSSLIWLASIPVLILLPYSGSSYFQDLLVLFTINIILVASYRLITTMGGWSFSHIATMGLGSYTMAMLTTKYYHLSFWITLPIGGAVSAVFGLLISFAVLRTKGFYFFLSTFAAGEALRQGFIQFRGFFGGVDGIAFIRPPEPILGYSFSNPVHYYYLVLPTAVLCLYLLRRLDTSSLGRTIKAVALNENLSKSFGIDTWQCEMTAFVIASFWAGVAGVLFGNYNGCVAPTDYTAVFMFKIIASSIVGGTSTFAGPILGLSFLTFLEEVFRDIHLIVPLIWGFCIIGVLLFLPRGLESLLFSVMAGKYSTWKGRRNKV
jgi:branched-chain amino acid transport system permease protein